MQKLILLILGSFLLAGSASGQKAQDSWDNLKRLQAGQKIEVVDMNLKSLKGTFVSVSEEAISLRVKDDEVAVQRPDVFRVGDREHARRGRNTLLGLGIGMGTGFGFGAALGRGGGAAHAAQVGVIFALPGAAAGATIGALVPSGSRTIYRAGTTPVPAPRR